MSGETKAIGDGWDYDIKVGDVIQHGWEYQFTHHAGWHSTVDIGRIIQPKDVGCYRRPAPPPEWASVETLRRERDEAVERAEKAEARVAELEFKLGAAEMDAGEILRAAAERGQRNAELEAERDFYRVDRDRFVARMKLLEGRLDRINRITEGRDE